MIREIEHAPQLNYEAPPGRRRFGAQWSTLTLQVITGYFVASILTLPVLDSLWLGEIPLLALIHIPKTAIAHWLRTDVVMPIVSAAGWSRGSFSPDYIMARPYALAIAYVMLLGFVFVALGVGRRVMRSPGVPWRWVGITLIAAAVDFAAMLWLAGGPGLTIY